MPNWKKVIVSGSNAVLNQITASGAIVSTNANSNLSGSFSGSFQGDGTNLNLAGNTTISTTPFPFAGDGIISGSLLISSSNVGGVSTASLSLQGSGSTIFSVQGSQGQLFSITDDLLHDNLVVNDISGDVIFKVSGSGLVTIPVGDLSGSGAATASYGHFIGDGGGLTNLNVGTADTASYVASSSIDGITDYVRIDQTGSMTVATASYVASSSIDGITDYVRIDQTSSFVTNSQTGSFILSTASLAQVISRSIASGDTDSTALRLFGSGSVSESGIFEVEGSAGPLFSVADGLDGVLMEVNNISGLPLFQVSSSNEVFVNRGNLTSGVTTATASFAMFSGSFQGNASQLTNISPSSITSGTFVTNSQTSSMTVATASYVISSSIDGITDYVRVDQTGSMTVATASYVISSSIDGITDYVRVDQTSSMSVATASFALTASSFVAVGTTKNLVVFTTSSGKLTAETGFEYDPATNQLTVESLNVTHFTSSFITSSRILTSGSNIFGDDTTDTQTLIGTTKMTGSAEVTGSLNISKEVTVGSAGQYGILFKNSSQQTLDIAQPTDANNIYLRISNTQISSSNSASFAHYTGDGGGLTNLNTGSAFPFTGDAQITGSLIVSGSGGLSVESSGSTVFEVIGSEGTLFSVDDDLDGTIFTANDRTGLPVLEASASGEVYIGKAPQSLYTTAVISSTTAATTQSIFGLSTSSYGGAFFDYTVHSGSNARAGSIMSVWNPNDEVASGADISFTETTTKDIGDTTDFNIIVHISQSQAQIASHATRAGYNIKTIIRSI